MADELGSERKIDLSALSWEQLRAVVMHLHERWIVTIAATNTMTAKLKQTGETGVKSDQVIREWRDFLNTAIARSDQEIGRLAGKLPPAVN